MRLWHLEFIRLQTLRETLSLENVLQWLENLLQAGPPCVRTCTRIHCVYSYVCQVHPTSSPVQVAFTTKKTDVAIASVSLGGPAYCTEYRGDWKWQRESFGLSCHWGAANFCHICTAKGKGSPLSKSLDCAWKVFLFVVHW